jgi:hypothetical protein
MVIWLHWPLSSSTRQLEILSGKVLTHQEVEQEWKAGMKSQLEGISSLVQDTKNAEQMDN